MAIYIVKKGDYVNKIADEYGVSATQIIFDNQLVSPYELAIGQALYIADSVKVSDRRMRVGGYAYPFINESVLNQTLPYLSELFVFSYGFTNEGELIYPKLQDQWMIDNATMYNALPILTLTPLGEDGKFNNGLITSVVNNESYTNRLISNLLEIMQEKNFMGLDIDFEYIRKEDRNAFTSFVAKITDIMNDEGYQVSVALAPKTSAMQTGLLYEGKDYKALGEVANKVLLMTYEWGYKFGPNMAVAPINKVRQVVEYAVTEIPRFKINLGIPNYGYDWLLPFERGVTTARTISNVEAVQIAVKQGVSINFDEVAMSPYFNYIEDGITHEVWFEDVRSIQAKIDLIKEFDLQGAGYWQINNLFRANWLLLNQQVDIEKF